MAISTYEQIVNDGFLYINGLGTTYTSATTLTVGTGQCRDSGNVFDLFLNSPAVLNSGVVGVNGLDTGTVAINSLYYIYLIGDLTNNNPSALLISLSSSAPVMPAGYGLLRLIGAWATNGSAQFYVGYQTGSGSAKNFYYDAPVSVLSGGSSATFAAVDLSAVVPAVNTLNEVFLNAQYTPNTAGNTFSLRPTGSSASGGASTIVASGVVAAKAQDFPMFRMISKLATGKPEIDYIVQSSDALTLLVAGFMQQL